ncbi:tetratricopeptide repeat protein [Mesorhizobium sp. ORM16]|uniref:tetratricopeptide repeat protein n=1 Tax=Mesorhizobium sp. ORM16 TaxID=3376989 RepID=UPI003857C873
MVDRQQDLENLQEQLSLLQRTSRFREAIELATHICELTRQRFGEVSKNFAISLNKLAELHQTVGDYTIAEQLYSQAQAVNEGVPLSDRGLTSAILGNFFAKIRNSSKNSTVENSDGLSDGIKNLGKIFLSKINSLGC